MSSVTAMTEPVGCSVQGCEQPAAASLQVRSLCREHFLFTCREQLELCRRWQEDRLSGNHRTAESVRQFLAECSLQVADLALNGKELKRDRKSTRLNSSHRCISYAVFCLKKKKKKKRKATTTRQRQQR